MIWIIVQHCQNSQEPSSVYTVYH